MLRLGEASQVPVPIDADEDQSPARKRGGGDKIPGANKARKEETSGRKNLALTYDDMKQLLAEQSASILQANREHAQSLIESLESRHGARLDKVDEQLHDVSTGLQGIEGRLLALEREVRSDRRSASDESLGEKRRTTLVFGGWERDTRKEKILNELRQAFKGLELEAKLSDTPFTTGPRKNIALLNFPLLRDEGDEDRRTRMHDIVLAISQSKVYTSAGRKLWCSYSKSKQQRDISNHCGWVKRALAQIDESWVRELDVEYGTGSVWLGDSLVASGTKTPNDGAHSDTMIVGKGSPPAWVDLAKLAKETKLPTKDLREAFENTRK